MCDPTPAPFGDVTRRWIAVDAKRRQREAARLLGRGCADDVFTTSTDPASCRPQTDVVGPAILSL